MNHISNHPERKTPTHTVVTRKKTPALTTYDVFLYETQFIPQDLKYKKV